MIPARHFTNPVSISLVAKMHLVSKVKRMKGFEEKRFVVINGKKHDDPLIKIGTKAAGDRVIFSITNNGLKCIEWPGMHTNPQAPQRIKKLQAELLTILKKREVLK
jgi:hypothetical protein